VPATAITPLDRRTARAVPRSTPGWPGWLATQASSPDMHNNKAEHTAEPALPASCRKIDMTENRGGCLVSTSHYAEPGRSDVIRRRVIQLAAGFARTRRRSLSFPPVSQADVP
jgi:hypothetical protein